MQAGRRPGLGSAADLVAEGGFEGEVLGLSSLILLRVNGNGMHAGSEEARSKANGGERETSTRGRMESTSQRSRD